MRTKVFGLLRTMRRLKLRKEQRPGEGMPPRYGVAYRRWDRGVNVLYPIPLHMVVAAWRKVEWWVKYGYTAGQLKSAEEAYRAGFEAGYQHGYHRGRRQDV